MRETIEHTLLKPTATWQELETALHFAEAHAVFGLCIYPAWVKPLCHLRTSHKLQLVSVVGFPFGNSTTSTKAFETENLLRAGADEIDMVLNFGHLFSGNSKAIVKEIDLIKGLMGPSHNLKVIIETGVLDKALLAEAFSAVAASRADFIKTSTGFQGEGAKLEDVVWISEQIKAQSLNLKIKASGGIKTKDFAKALLSAGATRLGTSSSHLLLDVIPPQMGKTCDTSRDY